MYRASLDIQKSNVKCFLPKSFALNQFHFDRKKEHRFYDGLQNQTTLKLDRIIIYCANFATDVTLTNTQTYTKAHGLYVYLDVSICSKIKSIIERNEQIVVPVICENRYEW